MPQADYEGWMATAYDAGRSLTPAALQTWNETARPFLSSDSAGLVPDLGAGTGRFSGHLAAWSCGPVIAVEPAIAMAGRAKDKNLADVHVVTGRAESIPMQGDTVRHHSARFGWCLPSDKLREQRTSRKRLRKPEPQEV